MKRPTAMFTTPVTRGNAMRGRHRRARRGNTIVLVAGILALLVIVATAYITRTQAGRITSTAVQHAGQRDGNADQIAEAIAGEVAGALFAWPVDTRGFGVGDPDALSTLPGVTANSNWPRFAPPSDATRYSVDPDDRISYNFAPYHVVPWTNWPDNDGRWPEGPGLGMKNVGDSNPWGGPGFGDSRWLRDTEPMRWNTNPLIDNWQDAFGQWRHLTNIARPNNEWRICWDISDVTQRLVTDLRVPCEQWLPIRPQRFGGTEAYSIGPSGNTSDGTGNIVYLGPSETLRRWQNWFRPLGALPNTLLRYYDIYDDPQQIPPNFYDLSDLDGDGFRLEVGERPEDEFEGPSTAWQLGSPRWNISRTLTDTDGDGFTDSFWFLAPTTVDRGIRQIVGISIVDNSGLLPAGHATRFVRNSTDSFGGIIGGGTRGLTPADLALVGQLGNYGTAPNNVWNVGLLDSPLNHEAFFPPTITGFNMYRSRSGDTDVFFDLDPSRQMWSAGSTTSPDRPMNYLRTLGLYDDGWTINPNFPGLLLTENDRVRYWQERLGRGPFTGETGLTPFTLADELELRMYHGQNYPWITSRFERAVQANVLDESGGQILRANIKREETTEYLDKLFNRELLFDHRRKLTLYSGARNDLKPRWLYWQDTYPDIDPALFRHAPQFVLNLGPNTIDYFANQTRTKLDLRDPDLDVDLFNNGVMPFWQRLTYALWLAFADTPTYPNPLPPGFPPGPVAGGSFSSDAVSYFGGYSNGADTEAQTTLHLATSFAANIEAWRDNDFEEFNGPKGEDILAEASIRPPDIPGVTDAATPTRFLGLEPQPFLVEAFVGHVHESEAIPPNVGGPPFFGFGIPSQSYFIDEQHDSSTIIVVQIANPFDVVIDLRDYKIAVMDQVLDLDGYFTANPGLDPFLPPATDEQPVTAVFYSIEQNALGDSFFDEKWRDYLDLNLRQINPNRYQPSQDLVPNTRLYDVTVFGSWSNDRNDYDNNAATTGAEILRTFTVDPLVPTFADVVVDRFDEGLPQGERFSSTIASLVPPPQRDQQFGDPPVWAGIRVPAEATWVSWVRVSRAWGVDFDYVPGNFNSAGIQQHERAPRFVFALQEVTTSDHPAYVGDQGAGRYSGNDFHLVNDIPDQPWFDRAFDFQPNPGVTVEQLRRKPTFFTMNPVFDRTGVQPVDLYPNFNDPAYRYGEFFYGQSLPNPGAPLRSGVPDKGVYDPDGRRLGFSLQMLHANRDFLQVGELLNVFLWGHELDVNQVEDPLRPNSGIYIVTGYNGTTKTFSEFMADDSLSGDDFRVNRLRIEPEQFSGQDVAEILGRGSVGDRRHPLQSVPDLPPALRVLEAFVCDGGGVLYLDLDGNSVLNIDDTRTSQYLGGRLNLANGFSGEATPGLINLNTMLPEVLQAAPHMTKLVHTTRSAVDNPRTALPDALIQYRDQYRPAADFGSDSGPDWYRRFTTGTLDTMREERGFASIGEVLVVNKAGSALFDPTGLAVPSVGWRADLGIEDGAVPPRLFTNSFGMHESLRISTDTKDEFDYGLNQFFPDEVAGDAEEANLLFNGISNLITTRSDVFTVYFRVRSFRQDPTTGRWDATNRENIVDESRYVMLVDRSNVERPADKPRILYLEKLPN